MSLLSSRELEILCTRHLMPGLRLSVHNIMDLSISRELVMVLEWSKNIWRDSSVNYGDDIALHALGPIPRRPSLVVNTRRSRQACRRLCQYKFAALVMLSEALSISWGSNRTLLCCVKHWQKYLNAATSFTQRWLMLRSGYKFAS
jgi:hypothetical protein